MSVSYAFAYHIDHGEFEEMVQLFTEDGVFDRVGQVLEGQEQIRQAMRDRPKMTTRHVFTNFHFHEIAPDNVVATAYCMSFHGMGESDNGPIVYGTTNGRLLEFRERYQNQGGGWKLAEHRAQAIFVPQVWP
jgi:ketosteroid isomerase-like protein